MQLVHQDVIYFDAQDAVVGRELFAYSLLNHSTWLVADLEPGAPGSGPAKTWQFPTVMLSSSQQL